MKIKALVSFSGVLSMYAGEEREYSDKAILLDLLKAKYIEEVKTEKLDKPVKTKKGVKSHENK